MNKKIFVGNLSYRMTEEQLNELFAPCGEVVSAVIPKDRDTGRSRGFGFVEMGTQAEAEAAIRELNGREIEGRQISVNISEPRPRNGAGGGRGGRRY